MAATQQMAIRMTVDTSSMTTELSRVMREFEKLGDALSRSASQASDAQQKIMVSAEQGTAALRGLLVESVKGFEEGKLPLSALIEQGGRLKDTFGGVGPAVRAVGGYVAELASPLTVAASAVAALGAAYYLGGKETTAYGNALILSGNAVGQTAGQLQDMAASIAKSNGALTQSTAADAITTFVRAGAAGAETLQQYSAAAADFERVTGQSVGATAAVFKALETAPLEASVKLKGEINHLTVATYEHIKALQEEGRYTEAGRVATDAYADSMAERTTQITQNIGYIQTAWNGVAAAMARVGSALLNVGRAPTNADQLSELRKLLAATEGPERWKFDDGSQMGKEAYARRTAVLKGRIAALEGAENFQTQQATAKAEAGQRTEAKSRWDQGGVKFLSAKDKRDREVSLARNEGKAAGVSEEEIETRVSDIRKEYLKKSASSGINRAGDDGLGGRIEAVREEYAAKARITAEGFKNIDSLRKRDLLDDYAVVRQKRDLRLKDLKDQEDEIQAELRLLGTKKGSAADRQKLEVRSKTVEQQRRFVNDDAERSYAELDATPRNAVLKTSQQATEKVREQTRALEEQNAVHGLSTEAIQQRTIAQTERQIQELDATENVDPAYLKSLQARLVAEKELAAATRDSERLKTTDEKQKKEKEKDEEKSKKMAGEIGGVFRDGFVNLLEGGGRDAIDKMGEGLKKKLVQSLADAFYDATLKDAVDGFSKWLSGSLKNAMSGGDGAKSGGGSLSGLGGILGAVSGLFGGFSGSTAAGLANTFGGSDPLGFMVNAMGLVKSANGNVFASPGLHAYANSVVGKPTFFPFANGIGLMGEAGPEAIMPLRRGSDGRLGVSAQGASGGGALHYAPSTVFHIDSRSDRGAVMADLDRALQANNQGQMEQLKRMRVVPQ